MHETLNIDDALWDRALGAYLGFAIGDALGATVEFMRPREIVQQYGVHRDMIGGGWLKLPAGRVTDDTTMSLALGDALLLSGNAGLQAFMQGDEAVVRAIGDSYVNWLKGKPVDCGNTCRRGIQRYLREGTLEGPYNPGDGGNGALMRNLPSALATLGDDQTFEKLSMAQARLTHNHPFSDSATLGLGQLLRLLLNGAQPVTCQQWIAQWIEQNAVFRFDPYRERATAYVVDTVQTVLHFFTRHENFEVAMVATVNQGDDADTTGALLGMLAGARCGASRLPARWLDRLQDATVQAITAQTRGLLELSAAPIL